MKWTDILFRCTIGIVAFIFIVVAVYIRLEFKSEADKYTLLVTDGKSTKYSKEQFYTEYINTLQENQDEVASGDDEEDAGSGEDEEDAGSGEDFVVEGSNVMDYWIKAATFTKGDVVKTLDGVSLYTDIPWEDDGNWYTLDLDAVTDFYGTYLGTYMHDVRNWAQDDAIDHATVEKNGVNCLGISWLASFSFCEWDESTLQPIGWNNIVSEYDDVYGVAIVRRNDDKSANPTLYYLPIASGGDNKGHTWPGGFAQTHLDNQSYLAGSDVYLHNFDTAADIRTADGVRLPAGNDYTQMSLSKLKSDYESFTYNGNAFAGNPVWIPNLGIETTSANGNTWREYRVLGYIIHKHVE